MRRSRIATPSYRTFPLVPSYHQYRPETIRAAFEEEGIEAWYRRPPEAFTKGHACAKCGNTAFRREQDILDVWFDSGVSWYAVAERQGMGVPVDLYAALPS